MKYTKKTVVIISVSEVMMDADLEAILAPTNRTVFYVLNKHLTITSVSFAEYAFEPIQSSR